MAKFLVCVVRRYRARPIKSAVLTVIALGLVVLVIWTAWANTALECNTYTVTSTKLPAAFDGFRIAQVSDLHNDVFGERNTYSLIVHKHHRRSAVRKGEGNQLICVRASQALSFPKGMDAYDLVAIV